MLNQSLLTNLFQIYIFSVSAMAERLANQFGIYRPATDLFVEYINGRRMEDARHLLQVIIHQEKYTFVCGLKRYNV